jgi:hypothetical protein
VSDFYDESLLDPAEQVNDYKGIVTSAKAEMNTYNPEKPYAQMVLHILLDDEYVVNEPYRDLRISCGTGFVPTDDGQFLVDEHSGKPKKFLETSSMGKLAARAMLSEDETFEHGKDEEDQPLQWPGFGLRDEFLEKRLVPHNAEAWVGRRFHVLSEKRGDFTITLPVEYMGMA